VSFATTAAEMKSFSGRAFIEDLIERDTAAALERCADDVEWVVPGDPRFGGGTHRGKERILAFLGRVIEFFPCGLRVETLADWPGPAGAVVEATLVGETARGLPYRNRYAFVLAVHDGRVAAIREYTDTAYAESLLAGC
jgi:hypothetical protein